MGILQGESRQHRQEHVADAGHVTYRKLNCICCALLLCYEVTWYLPCSTLAMLLRPSPTTPLLSHLVEEAGAAVSLSVAAVGAHLPR
jgi:hypothetical protein